MLAYSAERVYTNKVQTTLARTLYPETPDKVTITVTTDGVTGMVVVSDSCRVSGYNLDPEEITDIHTLYKILRREDDHVKAAIIGMLEEMVK